MTGRVPKMPSMKHLPWSQEDARQQKWLNKSETEELHWRKGGETETNNLQP